MNRHKNQLINREVSWLEFNERVLQEAMDETNPIIERLKFLGIFYLNSIKYLLIILLLKPQTKFG